MTTDNDIRAMLRTRAERSNGIDGSRLMTSALATPKTRPLMAGNLIGAVAVLAVILVAGGVWVRGGTTGAGLPLGLWQSDAAVGTGAVGSVLCVALELTDAAYRDGVVTVWWWEHGETGCRSSESSPFASSASLTPIRLASTSSAGERTGYAVALRLALLPAGEEVVKFVLDPAPGPSEQAQLVGYRGDETGQTVPFRLVKGLDIEPPGGVPAPTPLIAP